MEISPRRIGTGTLGEGPGSASAFEALRSCLVPQEQKIPLHAHPQPHSAHVKIQQKPALVRPPEQPALDVAPPADPLQWELNSTLQGWQRQLWLAATGRLSICVEKLKDSLS